MAIRARVTTRGWDGRAGRESSFSTMNSQTEPAIPISHDVIEVLVTNTVTAGDAEVTTTTPPEEPHAEEIQLDARARTLDIVVLGPSTLDISHPCHAGRGTELVILPPRHRGGREL